MVKKEERLGMCSKKYIDCELPRDNEVNENIMCAKKIGEGRNIKHRSTSPIVISWCVDVEIEKQSRSQKQLQPLIPPKRFDIFSPITGGCSEGLGVL